MPALAIAPVELLYASSVRSENGNLRSISWSLWDGSETSGPDRRVQVDAAGNYRGVLRAEDEAGLTCVSTVEAWVANGDGELKSRLGPAHYVVGCACSMDSGRAPAYWVLLWAAVSLSVLRAARRRPTVSR